MQSVLKVYLKCTLFKESVTQCVSAMMRAVLENTHEYMRFSTSSRVCTIYSINFTLVVFIYLSFFMSTGFPTPADRVLQVSSTWTPPRPYNTQNLTSDDVSHEEVNVRHLQIRFSKGCTVERFQNVSVLVVWSWVLCPLFFITMTWLKCMCLCVCHLPMRHIMDPSMKFIRPIIDLVWQDHLDFFVDFRGLLFP